MNRRVCLVLLFIGLFACLGFSSNSDEAGSYQNEIKDVLIRMSKAFADRDVKGFASEFVPEIAREIQAHPEEMKQAWEKYDAIKYQALSFTKVRGICYVIVRELFIEKGKKRPSENTDSQDIETYVFSQQADGHWKALDHFYSEAPFSLYTLWQESQKLLREYQRLKIPWRIEDLNVASKEYANLEERVRKAVWDNPLESAFYAESWTETIYLRQIELSVLADVCFRGASQETDPEKKAELLELASTLRCTATEALVLMARPALRVLQIRRESGNTVIEIELHPIVSLTTVDHTRQFSFDPTILQKESPDKLIQYVRASDFLLIDCNGKKTMARDLGSRDVYTARKELLLFERGGTGEILKEVGSLSINAPFLVTVRFPCAGEQCVPYSIFFGPFSALLIRPSAG